MIPRGRGYDEYIALKQEVLRSIPGGGDSVSGDLLQRCKEHVMKQHGRDVVSRRRLERIKTLKDLLTEFERRLLINPDKTGINPFLQIMEFLHRASSHVISSPMLDKVKNLTKRLQPRLPEPQPQDTAPSVILLTRDQRDMIISELTCPAAGQDWRHFLLGLGHDLNDRERVRLRLGDIDRLERDGPNYTVMRRALDMFERNCQLHDLTINVLQHSIDILLDSNIMGDPYKR